MKRSESEVMSDIAATYGELSPENLSCDGELPGPVVDGRRGLLLAKLRRLQLELGREVPEEEAWDWLRGRAAR
jgi:hypothetical protein